MIHGPSRVDVVNADQSFAYRGNDPFWTQILGVWESRHDAESPNQAHNWILLVPCGYLAHYDTGRQAIVYRPVQ
jgi:hypothetical protein